MEHLISLPWETSPSACSSRQPDEERRSEEDHYDIPDYHERRREIFPEIIDALNGNEELLERTAEIILAYFEEMVRAKYEIHG